MTRQPHKQYERAQRVIFRTAALINIPVSGAAGFVGSTRDNVDGRAHAPSRGRCRRTPLASELHGEADARRFCFVPSCDQMFGAEQSLVTLAGATVRMCMGLTDLN